MSEINFPDPQSDFSAESFGAPLPQIEQKRSRGRSTFFWLGLWAGVP